MPQGIGYGPLAQGLQKGSKGTPTGVAGPSRLSVGPKNVGFNNMGNKQPHLTQPAVSPLQAKFGTPQRPGGFQGKGRVQAPQRFSGGGISPRNRFLR